MNEWERKKKETLDYDTRSVMKIINNSRYGANDALTLEEY